MENSQLVIADTKLMHLQTLSIPMAASKEEDNTIKLLLPLVDHQERMTLREPLLLLDLVVVGKENKKHLT
jgi:hypothetical protein